VTPENEYLKRGDIVSVLSNEAPTTKGRVGNQQTRGAQKKLKFPDGDGEEFAAKGTLRKGISLRE